MQEKQVGGWGGQSAVSGEKSGSFLSLAFMDGKIPIPFFHSIVQPPAGNSLPRLPLPVPPIPQYRPLLPPADRPAISALLDRASPRLTHPSCLNRPNCRQLPGPPQLNPSRFRS